MTSKIVLIKASQAGAGYVLHYLMIFRVLKGYFKMFLYYVSQVLDEKYKGLKIFTVSVMSVLKETILCDFFPFVGKEYYG